MRRKLFLTAAAALLLSTGFWVGRSSTNAPPELAYPALWVPFEKSFPRLDEPALDPRFAGVLKKWTSDPMGVHPPQLNPSDLEVVDGVLRRFPRYYYLYDLRAWVMEQLAHPEPEIQEYRALVESAWNPDPEEFRI